MSDDEAAERKEFEEAWDEFFGAIRRARGRAAREMEKEGLSLAQFQLLYAFCDRRPAESLPVGALAESAGVAQPTATRMLDALEREGVVEREHSSEDRRVVTVRLTAAGRRLLRSKRKLVEARRLAVFEALPRQDRRRSARLLQCLAEALEQST